MATHWTPVAAAKSHILSQITPISEAEECPIEEALGRVLAADIIAPFNVPGHNNAAMDGFACHLADTTLADKTTLKIVGSSFAGHPYNQPFARGECVKIMTGGVVPPDTTIIVPIEQTANATDTTVTILPDSKRKNGDHIRLAGEDLKQGSIAIATGTRLLPPQIGLIASLGIARLQVWRRLRVAFFSSGDEVISHSQTLKQGDVFDSNRHTLRTMIERMGFCAVDYGIVKDNRTALTALLQQINRDNIDAIISSGGVSVGEADYIKEVIAEHGSILFWKVAMRPGRPLAYGKINHCDFFGLPGNPVSVMVCFYQFVAPALWQKSQCTTAPPPLFWARSTTPIKKVAGRTEYQRGIISNAADGQLTVTLTGNQGSGILSSMSQANAFIVLADQVGNINAGDWVTVQPFDGLI